MTDVNKQTSDQRMPSGLPSGDQPRQTLWVRPRGIILATVIFLIVISLIFGSGISQASTDQSISSIRHQKDLFSPQEYQFTGQGKILGGSIETWIVGGVPVLTADTTQSTGRIHPGDMVSVVGNINKNGVWVVERVTPINEDETFFSFAGPLESKSQDAWQVAGVMLLLDENTILGNEIPLGELVLATFQVQPDDSWLALEIQAFSALEKARIPTITPTPTPTQTPTPTRTPLPTVVPAKQLPSENNEKPSPSENDSSGQNGRVTVCHNPNHKKGGKTLVIDRTALSAHLDHGDTLGACR